MNIEMENNIKKYRKAKKLTLAQLGELAGTTGEQIRRLEGGLVSLRPNWANRISKALGVLPEDLYRWNAHRSESRPLQDEGFAGTTNMKFPNRLRYLRTLKDPPVPQSVFAEMLDTTVQNISFYDRGERKLPNKYATKIAEYFKVTPAYLQCLDEEAAPKSPQENYIPDMIMSQSSTKVPLYDVYVGAGVASPVLTDSPPIIQYLEVMGEDLKRKNAKADKVCYVTVKGNSMSPKFGDGERLLINTDVTAPEHDGLYVLHDGNGNLVKRVVRMIGTKPLKVKLISLNPEYGEQEVLADDICIHGEVIAAYRLI